MKAILKQKKNQRNEKENFEEQNFEEKMKNFVTEITNLITQ